MADQHKITCPDCGDSLSRRDFVKTVGGAAAAAGALPLFASPRAAQAGPAPKHAAGTAVKRFYDSLTDKQKKAVCFPFDHKKRTRISANWAVTEPTIGSDFYSQEQQKLIDEIFRGVTSEDGYERFLQQMDDDWGGFHEYHVAVFGEPGTGQFEWEMTGRHLTIRADGDSVENAAFGGPIVYGHGASNPKKNLFHYQTKRANEVFGALDTEQRDMALLPKAPRENRVPVQGETGQFPGVPVGELSSDQKELVESTIKTILAPYRTEDVEEALAMLKAGGGFESLSLAFYQQGDLQSDKVWDIWRLEGPTFVWHFRGAPHVHTYVNIGKKQA